jgi:putative Holliday junction resolvase
VIASEEKGRVLGVDWGSKRIGLALSDPTRTLASPLGVVRRRAGKRLPFRRIEEIVVAEGVNGLVIGLPLELDGSESPWTAEVRSVGRVLSDRLGIPVEFRDERFSSVDAEARVRSIGLPKARREQKDRIDRAAAALILQGWLDERGSG